MRLKTAVMAVAIVAVAAVGGAALYVRSQVKQGLEALITALSPFTDIHYNNLSVGLNGKIHIYEIDVRPRAINENISIEGIDIETPGLWYLVKLNKNTRDGKLPEKLRLSVRGIGISNGGAITSAIDRFIAMAAQAQNANPMTNCGETRYFDLKTYRRLGYDSFVFDIAVGYYFERGGSPLHVTTESRIRDLASVNLDLEFTGVPQVITPAVAAAHPRLRKFAVLYEDLSILNRVKNFCAKEAGITPEQFVNAEIEKSDEAYMAHWGFVPGPAIRAAYRDFLSNPKEIRLQGMPPAEVDMSAMRLFKPDDVVSMLNLRVSVNGKPIPDLDISTVAAAPTVEPKKSAEQIDAAVAAAEKKNQPAPPVAKPASPPSPIASAELEKEQFHNVPIKELTQYLNKRVRLTLVRGATREGLLLQVANGAARVERRYGTGTMVLAIPVKDIERAEVFY